MDARTELVNGRIDPPRVGEVRAGERQSLPYVVVDAAGGEMEPVSRFLQHLALGDRSALTVRSYAVDLLRWWRVLDVVEVAWDRATTDEVAVMVGWLRTAPNPQRRRRSATGAGVVNLKTGKASLAGGYAASTINHALSVLSRFYAFHAHHGRGPVVNPVPVTSRRRALLAHRSPIEPAPATPRAPLRQKTPLRAPRAIPDPLWDELFAAMTCHRDRALLAFYVSSGARASELLGLRLEHVDWSGQRIWVVSKGTGMLEPVPASPQAFTLLVLYLEQAGTPPPGMPVWRTRRGGQRPLSYWAMRRVLQRVNQRLGTNWTLHDMRHTAATRMVSDPALTLPEVQTVMRHAHLATTQTYLAVGIDELVAKLQDHYQRPRAEPIRLAAGYDPRDMQAVFGD